MTSRDWLSPLPWVAGQTITPQAEEFLARLVSEVRALRSEIDAATVISADHEARITALEP